jgi:acyl-CoA reductase-like NAD-dependent aldehyde dehydrogenase
MKIPVVLKPGREDPLTPFRLMQAMIAAGFPREAFGFYPRPTTAATPSSSAPAAPSRSATTPR